MLTASILIAVSCSDTIPDVLEVRIAAPSDGSTVQGDVPIEIEVNGNEPLEEIGLYKDEYRPEPGNAKQQR